MDKQTSGKVTVLAVLKPKRPFFDFALQELKSLLVVAGIDPTVALAPEYRKKGLPVPTKYQDIKTKDMKRGFFVHMEVEEDKLDLLQIVVDRSVMVRSFLKLYGEGKNLEDLIAKLNPEDVKHEVESEESFYFFVTSTFAKLKKEDKVAEIEKLNHLGWKGKCKITSPDRVFWIIQAWEFIEKDGSSFYEQVFFGREIVKTSADDKIFNSHYTLKNRLYLGPTSTDHELAFLMANQARVTQGEFVIDPFVGTGSILVAAAHFDAVCFGTEIDFRVIRGMGVGRKNPQCDIASKVDKVNVWSNFMQYGFNKPEILRMDCTNDIFKDQEVFDAIVCDPPYGIRAAARETGRKEQNPEIKEMKAERLRNKTEEEMKQILEHREAHGYMATKVCNMDATVIGLMALARRVLKVGGRLVFLFHIYKEQNFDEVFPKADDFEILDVSNNALGGEHSRLLITLMKKPPADSKTPVHEIAEGK